MGPIIKYAIDCKVYKLEGHSLYGDETFATDALAERIMVIKMRTRRMRTTVRVDSGASRGAGDEIRADVVLVAKPQTSMDFDDKIEIAGQTFVVTGKIARYDVDGKLNHWQVEGEIV